MDYFRLLNLTSEPFSNSPDPDFFFQSDQHRDCLQKLELALRLKRGLNIVIGAIGTGKTTLCRQLLRRLPPEDGFETHLILDPAFESARGILQRLVREMTGKDPQPETDESSLKEIIKDYLFDKGVAENTTVVLVIDEGQKLPEFCIEQLRELLNYETNNFKLLQIVIFAQPEFRQTMQLFPNFTDRINLLHLLNPFDFRNTKKMIDYRLKRAGSQADWQYYFTRSAMRAIYRISKGYPRKIINICHHCFLGMIVKDAKKITRSLVIATAKRNLIQVPLSLKLAPGFWIVSATIVIFAVYIIIWHPMGISEQPGLQPHESGLKKHLLSTAANAEQGAENLKNDKQIIAETTKTDPSVKQVSQTPQNKAATENQTSQDTGSDRVPVPAESMPKPPENIGKIKVRPNDTLADLIATIYGSFDPAILSKLLELNRHIRNPNSIRIGEQLIFPATPVRQQPAGLKVSWIRIAQSPTLATAVELLGQLRRLNTIPLRLMVSWNPDRGIAYEILVRGYFESSSSIEQVTKQLVTLPGQTITRLAGWPEDTTFFCDPYNEPFLLPASYNQQSG